MEKTKYISPAMRLLDYEEPVMVTISAVTGQSDDGDFNAGDGGDDDDIILATNRDNLWDEEW